MSVAIKYHGLGLSNLRPSTPETKLEVQHRSSDRNSSIPSFGVADGFDRSSRPSSILLGGCEPVASSEVSQEASNTSNTTTSLQERDPNSLFKDDYMRTLIDKHFKGENSSALHHVMGRLNKRPTGAELDSALQDLAKIRGRPLDEVKAEYQKYTELSDAAAARGYKCEDLNENSVGEHRDFMGSTNQLRYGQVVGDAYGIDPVFGALLNPTGGLVGPGNIAVDSGDTAVSYHGIVHDAAGYLLNAQGVGPGYDYLGLEGRDTTSPLSGQREGIRHWGELTGDNGVATNAEALVMEGIVGTADVVNDIKHVASDVVNGVGGGVSDVVSGVGGGVSDVVSGVGGGVSDVVSGVADSVGGAWDKVIHLF